jgi:hypothetical protein
MLWEQVANGSEIKHPETVVVPRDPQSLFQRSPRALVYFSLFAQEIENRLLADGEEFLNLFLNRGFFSTMLNNLTLSSSLFWVLLFVHTGGDGEVSKTFCNLISSLVLVVGGEPGCRWKSLCCFFSFRSALKMVGEDYVLNGPQWSSAGGGL